MRFVKPEIALIARTAIDDIQVHMMLDTIGCDVEVRNKYAFNSTEKTDAERLIELAGRRCYMSFEPGMNPNVTKIREDITEYITNIMKSGHGSVLEHYYCTFSIENVSRVFTGEMNRHRAGVGISEASMRYIRYTDIPFVQTPMITLSDEEKEELSAMFNGPVLDSLPNTLAVKKMKTLELFKKSSEQDEENYKEFCEIWADELKPDSKFADKKHVTSLGRRTIPMGIATGGIWTFNIRALRHMLTMRASEAAEEEICLVTTKMLKIMMKEEPVLFGDFTQDEKGFWGPRYKKV